MNRLDDGDDELSVSQAVDGEKAIFMGTTTNDISSTLRPTNETFSAGADDFLKEGSVSVMLGAIESKEFYFSRPFIVRSDMRKASSQTTHFL